MDSIADRISDLRLVLPDPPVPLANYVPVVREGDLLYTSGMICTFNGKMTHTGKVGKDLDVDQAYEGAQICALNLLAAIKQVAGSLDSVERVISVTGYVNGTPEITDSSHVINGASDLLGKVFGESGRHARSVVTVAALPSNSAVEIAAVVKLKARC